MKDIRDFLIKGFGIKDPKEDKQVVVDTIKNLSGVEVDIKSVDFSGDSLKLKISATERSSIFMFHQKILPVLQEKIKDRKIKRIV